MLMTADQMLQGRKLKGWNQEQAALRLDVSQPYLSLLERGVRRVPRALARKAASVYGMTAAALPVETSWDNVHPADENELAAELASLGYPGLLYLKPRCKKKNPAEVLLSALFAPDLDSRLIEALPWIVWKFPDMDWNWLTAAAKVHDLQNKLGYVTVVARQLAERSGEANKVAQLSRREADLDRSRLAREGTLCHDSMTEAERRWLRKHRPAEARRWRLLTELAPEHLTHAA
jgi:transcriptional regulator with XRE-family HTH domain